MKFEKYNIAKEIIYFIDMDGMEYTLMEEPGFIYNYIDKLVNSNSTLCVFDQSSKPLSLRASNIRSIFFYNGNRMYLRLQR